MRQSEDRTHVGLLTAIAQVANLLLRGSIEPASRLPDYTPVLPDVVRLLSKAVGSDRALKSENWD